MAAAFRSVARALGSVSALYKDINPATLSGAIDIIVVSTTLENGEIELACSPFHVRFGKLSVLRPLSRSVRVKVNGEIIPFPMKISETGEVFFIFETDAENVPEELLTSPLTEPVKDADIEKGQGPEGIDTQEVELLDLGDSLTSPPKPAPASVAETTSSMNDSSFLSDSTSPTSLSASEKPLSDSDPEPYESETKNSSKESQETFGASDLSPQDNEGDPTEQSDTGLEQVSKGFLEAATRTAAAGKAVIGSTLGVKDLLTSKKLGGSTSQGITTDQGMGVEEKGEVGQLEEGMRKDLEGKQLDEDELKRVKEVARVEALDEVPNSNNVSNEKINGEINPFQNSPTTSALDVSKDVLQAAKKKVSISDDLNSQHVKETSQPFLSPAELSSISTGPHNTKNPKELYGGPGPDIGNVPTTLANGDLMLDMSGYKVKSKDVDQVRATEDTLLSEELGLSEGINGDGAPEQEVLALSRALLRSADLQRSRLGSHQLAKMTSETETVTPNSHDEHRIIFTRHESAEPEPLKPDLPTEPSKSGEILSKVSRASSPLPGEFRPTSPSPSIADSFQLSSMKAVGSNQFSIKDEGVMHVFELSLCGTQGPDKNVDDNAFRQHQVNYDQLKDQANLIENPNLVMRYNRKYLTRSNANGVFTSLTLYLQAAREHAAEHEMNEGGNDLADVDSKRNNRTLPWTRWWRGKAEEGETVEPFQNVPASPEPQSPIPTPPLENSMRELDLDKQIENQPVEAVTEARTETIIEMEGDSEMYEDAGDRRKTFVKTLRLTSDQLKQLNLKSGVNTISFTVLSSYSGVSKCTARIFLWEGDQQIVISDIDGTITKSDALGHVFAMIGRDWTHQGVAKLYTDIARNGYKIMYLTSRAIGQADTTREYLKSIVQNNYQLPEGPVIMSPDRLMTSLHREVIMRKPEVFKMACLKDIQRLFKIRSPFYAGFGNRFTDALSYRSVDVPSSRIFTIDSTGDVKMEFLELSGYRSSYIAMTDLVDQMFPPINRKSAAEFTDFEFWRTPIPMYDLPDLAPPSPALSARSDSSTRISIRRLGSLGLSKRSSKTNLSEKPTIEGQTPQATSSWTSMLTRSRASSPHPTSPLARATEIAEIDEELEEGTLGQPVDDDWNLGGESMPGSLELPGQLDRMAEEWDKKPRNPLRDEANDMEEQRSPEEENLEEEDYLAAGEMDLDFTSVPY